MHLRRLLPVLDLVLMETAYILAFMLRFEGNIQPQHIAQFWQFMLIVPLVRYACNALYGIYRQAWHYIGMLEIKSIGLSYVTGSTIFAFVLYASSNASFPRSIIGIELVLSLVLILGFRYLLRYFHEAMETKPKVSKATLIVGAGDAGEMLARDMIRHPENGLRPIAFIDDDPSKRGMRIHGIEVKGNRADISRLVQSLAVEQIVLAIPSASKTSQREILEVCTATSVQVRIIPALHEIIKGTVSVNHLREVEIEDLLGREPVVLDDTRLNAFLTNRVVLVSGAGGSIGSELCRQIAEYQPACLLLMGHGENSIYSIEQELGKRCNIVPVIADVRDKVRLNAIMARYRPHLVFHAAAHKHVPLMEQNPTEAASNNVLGTRNLAEAAEKHGVEAFVLISTDKAVNPTSVMGMSKRLAELSILDLARSSKTKFTAVRFGNVLGSRGSVVPLFKQQIAKGGPLTVTHPEMTRYFMTIPEAASLVLQSGTLGCQGEVFLLEMGEPVRIVDLAKNLIFLSGCREEDIGIVFTGIRPGEKLFEELRTDCEGVRKTEHPQIFAVRSLIAYGAEEWRQCLSRIDEMVKNQDDRQMQQLLMQIVSRDIKINTDNSENQDDKERVQK